MTSRHRTERSRRPPPLRRLWRAPPGRRRLIASLICGVAEHVKRRRSSAPTPSSIASIRTWAFRAAVAPAWTSSLLSQAYASALLLSHMRCAPDDLGRTEPCRRGRHCAMGCRACKRQRRPGRKPQPEVLPREPKTCCTKGKRLDRGWTARVGRLEKRLYPSPG